MNTISRGRRKVWRIQNANTSSSSPVLWCTILVASRPKKRTHGIPRRRFHEVALALDLHVLADDLDQIFPRVLQVQRRAGELQAQRIAEERALEHFLADRDEDLDVIVDRMQVTRRERDADLREVPVAAIDCALLLGVDQVAGEKILEVFVDVVDEHCDRAVNASENRQQVRNIVLECREIGVARQSQQIGEQVAGAAQVLVAHHLVERSGELGAEPQMLLYGKRQRDRPERLPIGLGLAHGAVLAVAHQVRIGARLVDQGPLGQDRAIALPHRLALGLEEQRLAEALGGDDQDRLGGRRIEKVGDLVVEVQQLAAELVEVLRLDVLGIDHPRFHRVLPPVGAAAIRNAASPPSRSQSAGVPVADLEFTFC